MAHWQMGSQHCRRGKVRLHQQVLGRPNSQKGSVKVCTPRVWWEEVGRKRE